MNLVFWAQIFFIGTLNEYEKLYLLVKELMEKLVELLSSVNCSGV